MTLRAWLLVCLVTAAMAACNVAFAQPTGSGWAECAEPGTDCVRETGFWQAQVWRRMFNYSTCVFGSAYEFEYEAVHTSGLNYSVSGGTEYCESSDTWIDMPAAIVYVRALQDPDAPGSGGTDVLLKLERPTAAQCREAFIWGMSAVIGCYLVGWGAGRVLQAIERDERA